jgi:hypothetical protein
MPEVFSKITIKSDSYLGFTKFTMDLIVEKFKIRRVVIDAKNFIISLKAV